MSVPRPYRWFERGLTGWDTVPGAAAWLARGPGRLEDPADASWAAWGRADAASAGAVRTRWIGGDDLAGFAAEAGALLGRSVPPAAAVCLIGDELAALACTPPGQGVPAPWDVVLHELLELDDPALVDRWLAGSAPPPATTLPAPGPDRPATWGASLGPDGARLRFRTEGPCWVRREPMPAAYYGTDEPIPAPLAPLDAPALVRRRVADVAPLPASWRADLWLGWLHRHPPSALVLALGPDDVEPLAAATAQTGVAGPLLAALGERLLLAGEVAPLPPDAARTPAERAGALALAVAGVRTAAGRALWVSARDWESGWLDLRHPRVDDELVRPLRAALVAGRVEEAAGRLALAAEVGGGVALEVLRLRLVGDGTVSPAEWMEYVGAEARRDA